MLKHLIRKWHIRSHKVDNYKHNWGNVLIIGL